MLSTQLANRFREVTLNGTWVAGTNLQATVADLSWEEATQKVGDLNTIALLCFHIHYYIAGVLQVLEGGTLDIKDKYSFDASPITAQEDWDKLRQKIWQDAARFAELVEKMSDEQLFAPFVRPEYGNYLRNIEVIIEHSYYHFGQISLVKKLVRAANA